MYQTFFSELRDWRDARVRDDDLSDLVSDTHRRCEVPRPKNRFQKRVVLVRK